MANRRLGFEDLMKVYQGNLQSFVLNYCPELAPAFEKKAMSGGIRIGKYSIRIAKGFNLHGKWYANDFTPTAFGATGLVMHFNNWSARDLLEAFNHDMGIETSNPIDIESAKKEAAKRAAILKKQEQARESREKRQAQSNLQKLWFNDNTVKPKETGFALAKQYLMNRGIDPSFLPQNVAVDLRFNPSVYFNETKDGGKKGYSPALLAMVRDKDWKKATIHRTYLSEEGCKNTKMLDPKKIMSKQRNYTGGGIWLGRPAPHLVLGEGIESTLSGLIGTADKTSISGVSTICNTLMAAFDPSSYADRIETATIFADNDENGSGQEAAFTLAERLLKLDIQVDVKIPPNAGQDWNDCLQLLSVEDFRVLVQASSA